ncbi:hypothetical protein CSUI_004267 [Cystoisospora suis]|uniref:Uncharacterized protein n=1 Tax=Cystoisospora suis TaxID=483139 RepID=A0A2C6KXX2_9APIC|nr:hypothetical protein CSUI_004267 [Cystoisospora suis]
MLLAFPCRPRFASWFGHHLSRSTWTPVQNVALSVPSTKGTSMRSLYWRAVPVTSEGVAATRIESEHLLEGKGSPRSLFVSTFTQMRTSKERKKDCPQRDLSSLVKTTR